MMPKAEKSTILMRVYEVSRLILAGAEFPGRSAATSKSPIAGWRMPPIAISYNCLGGT